MGVITNHKLQKTILDIFIHSLTTTAIALTIYLKSNNLAFAAIFIVGGIFIDLDHFIDYFLFFKKFDMKKFLDSAYLYSEKVYLPLHSWELTLVILFLGYILQSKALLMLAFSLSIHLLIDTMQREKLLFYFITYRFIKKFNVKTLLPEFSNTTI
ncbi:MAG: hypothetical protein Q8O30_06810 [Candidatus Omnitrophota bacterium]|nr:hypothetical protein [Candidatus Omnitrophota bacterium]